MCDVNDAMEEEEAIHGEIAPAEAADPSSASDPNQKHDKKPTRQWAAWTRKEEENFFNALRQVGKNFDKITVRVQSKSKDQVRHYYYRLVRRMKKLLGPGFSLDAKNSKDTIAAMLRWWSLLEKFSCSASKLHLKPRRFKIFVEALGNQLLKDRNKTRRKCPQGDTHMPSSSPTLSKTQGNESFAVKSLPVDAQSGSKLAAAKGAFFKRVGEPNSSCKVGTVKGDPSATRTVKQKRRSGGPVASAAYRKWERAAMAGVSLVADAAEQLERNVLNQRLCNSDDGTALPNTLSTVNVIGTNQIKGADLQPSSKLKLQLFPINEVTRKALEKDELNPYLELTLSARKKISSVLEHLNRKWGNSNIASGELVLFPYSAHQEDLATHDKWTMKDTVSVADVFISVNSPPVFRLRYGWFPLAEAEAGVTETPAAHFENYMMPEDIQSKCSTGDETHTRKDDTLLSNCIPEKHPDRPKDQSTLVHDMPPNAGKDVELPDQSINTSPSQDDRQKQEQVLANQVEADLGMNCATLSEGEWADSLTDISIGYLLAEASRGVGSDCLGTSAGKKTSYDENSCDSFDAAVALHVSRYQAAARPANVSHSTIWSAEETCDQFCYSLAAAWKQEGSSTSTSSSPENTNEICPSNSDGFHGFLQNLAGAEIANDPCNNGMKNVEALRADSPHHTNNNVELKDPPLADIYWPDSLGPLDLEMPSLRYQAQDLFSDSQNSWSRVMESSLDAFRNLSFFVMDNVDPIPSVDK